MEIGMHNEGNGSAAPLQFSKVLPCDVSNLKKILACQELVYIIIVLIKKKLQKISFKNGKNECKLFSDQKPSRQSVVVAGQRNFP